MAKHKKNPDPDPDPVAGSRPRSKGGTRGSLFEQISIIRLQDANVLLGKKRHAGALYLAGYAIECRLKWAVTKRNNLVYLPAEYETHNLDKLLIAAGLETALKNAGQLQSVYSSFADRWGPELRYITSDPGVETTNALYGQIKQVYNWISENTI